jgi:hypothetical protein
VVCDNSSQGFDQSSALFFFNIRIDDVHDFILFHLVHLLLVYTAISGKEQISLLAKKIITEQQNKGNHFFASLCINRTINTLDDRQR